MFNKALVKSDRILNSLYSIEKEFQKTLGIVNFVIENNNYLISPKEENSEEEFDKIEKN